MILCSKDFRLHFCEGYSCYFLYFFTDSQITLNRALVKMVTGCIGRSCNIVNEKHTVLIYIPTIINNAIYIYFNYYYDEYYDLPL